LIDPEDDDCGYLDCCEECVSAAIEPHGYASAVFELCKQVFDPVTLLV
jgi:hypothetical protein